MLVQSNGALTVRNKARIEGNIQADGGLYVRVLESARVGGDIQLKGLSGQGSYVKNSTVGGNLQMENNRIPCRRSTTLLMATCRHSATPGA